MRKRRQVLKHEPHNKFKSYLMENRITQRKVAELLGLSTVAINQKINGSLHFSFNEVEKICDEYGIYPDIFLTKKLRKSNNIQNS